MRKNCPPTILDKKKSFFINFFLLRIRIALKIGKPQMQYYAHNGKKLVSNQKVLFKKKLNYYNYESILFVVLKF